MGHVETSTGSTMFPRIPEATRIPMYISSIQKQVYFHWVDQLDGPIAPSRNCPERLAISLDFSLKIKTLLAYPACLIC